MLDLLNVLTAPEVRNLNVFRCLALLLEPPNNVGHFVFEFVANALQVFLLVSPEYLQKQYSETLY